MGKRLIGYATTDSNGIAVLNYIGQGLGELNISAETGGEVAFADDGHTGSLSSRWGQWSTYPSTITRGTEFTTITKNSSSTLGYHILDLRDLSFDVIEFDLFVDSSVNNNIIFQFRNESRTVNGQLALSNWSIGTDHLNEWIHFKCDFNTNKISNSVNSTTVDLNFQDSTRLYFAVQVAQNSLRYRNLFLYKGTSTLVSEPITVIDGLFFDKAVTGEKSTEWGYNSTDIQISTDNNGTTISNTGSTGRTYWANYVGTSKTTGDEWNNPLVIEVDMLSASGTGTNVALQLVKGSSAVSRNMSQLGVVNGGHIKIVCDGETAKYYVNDSETPNHSQNWTETDFSIRFYLANGYNFKYKNFVVYPI